MSKFKDQNKPHNPAEIDAQIEAAKAKFEANEKYQEPPPAVEAEPMQQQQQNQMTIEQRQEAWLQKHDLSREVWSALQNSLYPGSAPESIMMVVEYCRARKLDPLKKPCHIVPMNVKDAKSGKYEWRDVVMPGIYEYRMTASRSGTFAGISEPEFGPMIEYKGIKAPEWCRMAVYRFINDQKCEFWHTEFFEEAVNVKKDGSPNAMWTKRPRGQLMKCAEAGALRKAFPDELGGEITAEEAKENFVEGEVVKAKAKKDINELI